MLLSIHSQRDGWGWMEVGGLTETVLSHASLEKGSEVALKSGPCQLDLRDIQQRMGRTVSRLLIQPVLIQPIVLDNTNDFLYSSSRIPMIDHLKPLKTPL